MTNLFQGFQTGNAKRGKTGVAIATKYQPSSNLYCVILWRNSVNLICLMSLHLRCWKDQSFLGSREEKSILYRAAYCGGTQGLLEKVTISMKITKLLLRQKLKVKGYLIVTFFLVCASEIVKKVIYLCILYKQVNFFLTFG